MTEYTQHPLSAAFPAMPPDEFAELKADIEAHGIVNPIVLHEDKVLDGWHRYRAARELGAADEVPETYLPHLIDPVDYVLSQNLRRRHLTPSQAGAIVCDMTEHRERGRPSAGATSPAKHHTAKGEKNGTIVPFSTAALAAKHDVSDRLVKRAKEVKRVSAPLHEAVKAGTITVNDALTTAKAIKSAPDPLAAKISAAAAVKEVAENKASGSRTYKTVSAVFKRRQIERNEREKPLPPKGKYDVVVVDPPWDIKRITLEGGANKYEAETLDYPTMSVDEIKDIDVPATGDAWIFLWTTNRYLPMAFDVLRAWGVDYRYTLVWAKDQGPRQPRQPETRCEYCLIASRGKPVWYETGGFTTLLVAKRERAHGHSAKPEAFYALLRAVTRGRRIDMFGRRPIDGFVTWGNETQKCR